MIQDRHLALIYMVSGVGILSLGFIVDPPVKFDLLILSMIFTAIAMIIHHRKDGSIYVVPTLVFFLWGRLHIYPKPEFLIEFIYVAGCTVFFYGVHYIFYKGEE